MASTTYNHQIAGTHGAASGRGFFGTLAHFATTAIQTLARWQHRREQRRHLVSLDDRMLQDIGVSRVEAELEADKPFWRA